MPSNFGDAIKKKLEEYNCRLVRYGKGDHEIWFSPITKRNFTVDPGTKSRHTANNIMKDAGIKHKF